MKDPASVHLIVTGGTISMVPAENGGVVPALTGEHLLDGVSHAVEHLRVTSETPFLVASVAFSFEQLGLIAQRVEAAIDSGVAGVVLVQGTDTIDETAFVLDLIFAGCAVPVVVTGAMRHPSAIGSDGPANLVAAINVAAAEEMRGQGVLVVLDDRVHSARYVEKSHSAALCAFESPGAGPLAEIVENEIRLSWRCRCVEAGFTGAKAAFADVAIVKTALGDDGRLLRVVAEQGYAGAVVEGLGGGHLPEAVADRAQELADRMPVVLAKRVRGGPVLTRTYGFKGSERDLIARGLVPAGRLGPTKARLLLALLIGNGAGRDEIAKCFLNHS